MRRPRLFVAVPALLALILAVPASAAGVSAGGTCAKAGAKAKSGSKTFVCTKSGKRLVWKPAPTAKPSEFPPVTGPDPNYRTIAFYYGWYGAPAIDGRWIHWHDAPRGAAPPADIASDFSPQLGAYSSRDPQVVAQHMAWLRQAGVGVIALSWWMDESADSMTKLVMDTAAKYGIKVTFHIEPANARDADRFQSEVLSLIKKYGSHPAFFTTTATSPYVTTTKPKSMFFMWAACVYSNARPERVTPGYWKQANDALHKQANALIISDPCDFDYIGAVNVQHFDGAYNYATLDLKRDGYFNWARALPENALYIPSVIPGFEAERMAYDPGTLTPRANGALYDEQWTAALDTGIAPDFVTITSFNEWHEGSMIEPAKRSTPGGTRTYKDYGTLDPTYYLTRTRYWVDQWPTKTFPSQSGKRLRIIVSSSADWSVFKLSAGTAFRPAAVDCGGAPERSNFDGSAWSMNQSLDKAQAGNEMRLCYDVTASGTALAFTYNAGFIGMGSVVVQQPKADGTFTTLQRLEWTGMVDDGVTRSITIG